MKGNGMIIYRSLTNPNSYRIDLKGKFLQLGMVQLDSFEAQLIKVASESIAPGQYGNIHISISVTPMSMEEVSK